MPGQTLLLITNVKRLTMKHSCVLIWMDIQTIDTGGVRRQVYTLAYEAFATNQFIRLFDGPEHHLRPAYSAEARSSGLLKI